MFSVLSSSKIIVSIVEDGVSFTGFTVIVTEAKEASPSASVIEY
jgi:hypothetical protein